MRPTDERGRPMGASPGDLPAGEATPSRQSYADCGRGTPGRRGSGGGGGGSWPPPPALDHQFFFSTNFLTSKKRKNRSEYSMDAMYLNLMFINPRPPVGAGAKGARSTRPSLTPPAKNPGSAPAGRPASTAAGFDIGLHRAPDRCTNWHFVLSVVEKPSSKVSLDLVYCGLFETESVLYWF